MAKYKTQVVSFVRNCPQNKGEQKLNPGAACMSNNGARPTAVLVHAAWFDGSSWNKVIAELTRRGYHAVAAQLPMTSLREDVAALRQLLRRQNGPVVLVGHSYGGAVITAAGAADANVKALVYVAAIVPDEGETVGELFTRTPPHPQAPALSPDEEGFLWVGPDAFRNAIAPDASSEETALLSAAQKPINVRCLGEPMGKPAWREKPSWFLVAENDRMVSSETQWFAARRMQSKVLALKSDHTPLVSKPAAVADTIEQALRSAQNSAAARSVTSEGC
jgi:pimeloyl-ACP methyl ester carboxylesterase